MLRTEPNICKIFDEVDAAMRGGSETPLLDTDADDVDCLLFMLLLLLVVVAVVGWVLTGEVGRLLPLSLPLPLPADLPPNVPREMT